MTYQPESTKICVLGLGYIGLPTASVLATKGYQVCGVDVHSHVVETINRGEIHIEEPDLDIVVRSAVGSGRLCASNTVQEADIYMICVPTPTNVDHSPDLSYVEEASRTLRQVVKKGDLIILESTSPPKTTREIVAKLAIPEGLTVGGDVFVAHCPERVLPGRILLEVVQNDRVVGGVTPNCAQKAKEFYETFVSGNVYATNDLAAEVTKLVENSFRDVNIAFANELSILAERWGIDAWEVIELANRHPRVNILTPGPGVGGHCISVDPWFLVHSEPDHTPLIRTAREVNDSKPDYIVRRVEALAKQFNRPKIGCLGLTYKPDVDDLRCSPSLEIVRKLVANDIGDILVCDPLITEEQFSDLPLFSLERLLEESQILVLLTDHKPFYNIPKNILQEKVIVDSRGIWR
ncbi:MAG: UDP-N-acetyl-D-mannosamine dehydrogenase [Pirellulaceae bacterium]|nr:UDP-N-acetyl-D-mannosamine dehydrogenase [Pirellulaceae bacterium]